MVMNSQWFRSVVRRVMERAFAIGRTYRPPTKPSAWLYHEGRMTVDMLASDGPRPDGPLYKIWSQIPGGHKWWHYFKLYEGTLGHLRTRPIRFLEIGVYKGASLTMWKNYLHADSTVVGIDIDSQCSTFDNGAGGIHVRIGDQTDVAFLDKVFKEFGRFDVILDDGSHVCSHMIKTFAHAFLHGLTDQGIYIAEDTHSNFWASYRDQPYSFLDFCKDLVDLSHSHYFSSESIQPFTLGYGGRAKSITVPRIGAEVEAISFSDSVVVIHRNSRRALPTVEHS